MGLPNPSRETKFSGANGDSEMFIFPVQLTTSRIGNLTRLILLLLYVMTIPYIQIDFTLLASEGFSWPRNLIRRYCITKRVCP